MSVQTGTIAITSYDTSLKPFFKSLNQEWLDKYFFMTEEDEKILDHPEKIIEAGGSVFFAMLGNEVVGTCALIREPDGSFELAKMDVTEEARGKGIGFRLLEHAMAEARRGGATRITLETATKLTAAISLYKKAGFIQTGPEHVHELFKRVTFSMEKLL